MMLTSALATFAAAAAWAQTLATPAAAMRQAQAELVSARAAILAYYPADAKSKGVEGTATLGCRRTEDGAYISCALLSEAPAGMGFGAAALAIAGAAKGETSVRIPRAYAEVSHPVTFSFRLAPPTIEPNLLLGHVIQPPMWPGEPPPELFPSEAARRGVDGEVVLDCLGGLDGHFTDCAIVSEVPPGLGFGRAALARAAKMRVSNPTRAPIRTVLVPLNFHVVR
jgi:outer membrane biosynthesis protein TonB